MSTHASEKSVTIPPNPSASTPPKIIELQAQNGKFEVILNNPHAKRLTIFMLGGRKERFVPPAQWFADFKRILDEALADPRDRVVVTHPFVSVLQVDLPEGPVIVTSPVLEVPRVLQEGYGAVKLPDGGSYRVKVDDGCFVVGTEAAPGQCVWLSRAMITWLAEHVTALS